MRMVGLPQCFEGSATLPSGPPIPIAATYEVAGDTWTVTFDQPLKAATLDITNWLLRINNFTVTTLTAVVSGSQVLGTASKVGGAVQPNDVEYAPPPDNVQSILSVPAVAFSEFPFVVS